VSVLRIEVNVTATAPDCAQSALIVDAMRRPTELALSCAELAL